MTSRLFFVAGEQSGDTRAAGVCRAIQRIEPDLQLKGAGGEEMKSAGVDVMLDMAKEGVVGLWEVLGKLHYFAQSYRLVLSSIRSFDPDGVVLVDFPGFNLKLAKQLHREGIPVIYYISPQVWAWRKYRIKSIRRYVDLMIVLFQFEEDLYENANVPVQWVGHPLVDEIVPENGSARTDTLRSEHNLSEDDTVLGVLPGSRESEFQRHYPVMIRAVRQLSESHPVDATFVPIAPELRHDRIEPMKQSAPHINEQWMPGKAREVMDSADVLLTASGTTTLEAALLETPMVVCYRVNPVTWALGLLLVETDHIALVNLVAGESVVPECIQWQATPKRLSDELHLLLQEDTHRSCKNRLATVRKRLGPPGASRRAAETILNFLNRN